MLEEPWLQGLFGFPWSVMVLSWLHVGS